MAARRHRNTAILFSGGDTPGMNPLVRAFVRLGHKRHHRGILGVKDGYDGLVRTARRLRRRNGIEDVRGEIKEFAGRAGIRRRSQDIVLLDDLSVSGIIDRGGIVLGSARCPKFKRKAVRQKAIDLLGDLGVTGLVVVGGDGSLKGAKRLSESSDLQVVGIPATIDNDYPLSEMCLGVDTAVNTIVSCVRSVNDTARSHHRIIVIEIMGRECGYLAQTAALAAGAEIVLTPEHGAVDDDKLCGIAERIGQLMQQGRGHAVVLVAEGVKLKLSENAEEKGDPAKKVANFLESHFDFKSKLDRKVEIRHSVLGHLQRGGSPTAADRLLAANFADAAWRKLAGNTRRSGVLGVIRGRIRLQAFDTVPPERLQGDVERGYRLQKDVSKHQDAVDSVVSDSPKPKTRTTTKRPSKSRRAVRP